MVSLEAESWIWYGFATAILLTRVVARAVKLRSPKHLQSDDWLMLVVLAFFTLEIVALNIVDRSDTNLLPPDYLDNHVLDPAEIQLRSTGSKWVLVVEQCQCVAIWLVKGCLLVMYHRLTEHTYPTQHFLVQVLIAYVVVNFVVMELLYFLAWCRPFHNYWAVPTPSVQCSAAINHLITNAVFNLSSDVAMLCIALPMFIRSRMPLQRKLTLCAIFGLGVFVILCAVLNKYYSFTNPFGREWENWYVREVSTAILVANLPFTWGLVRSLFRVDDDQASQATGGMNSRARSFAEQSSTIDGRSIASRDRGRTDSGIFSIFKGIKLPNLKDSRKFDERQSSIVHTPPNVEFGSNRVDVASAPTNHRLEEYETVSYPGRLQTSS